MGASLRLGKIFGIPFGVNYSWFLIFGVLTIILAVSQFPARLIDLTPQAYWVLALITSLLFFGSVVVHELAHSAVSIATGIPVKGITLFIFGGVAQIEREPNRPRDEFLMALAGPIASFGLGILFGALYLVSRPFSQPLAAVSEWLALINLSLGAFNLIPGFPLDGGRVLRSILWGINRNPLQATQIACIAGRATGYLFIFSGLLFIFWGAQNDAGILFNGLWLAFVGWFLDNAAQSSWQQAKTRHSLQGLTARDLISSDFPRVAATIPISELVEQHFFRSTHRTYLVAAEEEPLGLVSPQTIKQVPRHLWEVTSVREAMVPLGQLKKAAASEDAITLLDRMEEFNLSQLPVEDQGHILGLVRRDSLLQLIRTRSELGA